MIDQQLFKRNAYAINLSIVGIMFNTSNEIGYS